MSSAHSGPRQCDVRVRTMPVASTTNGNKYSATESVTEADGVFFSEGAEQATLDAVGVVDNLKSSIGRITTMVT